ncbi:GTP-binding protein Rhes [Cytospora mali]|uniref:GTP-binding protein Rhes n=1 Tax=Cytospora mali TaxID=578113 RepID=A0A194VC49_CYTMA|nr:GTP-binding protein Rhes [Valsa mali var. pyri (nom. inval.)]
MSSMVFTDEEARYIRAILKWQEKSAEDNTAAWVLNNLRLPERKPVGEFRILVLGAQGVGKTSILSQFCAGVFPDPSTPSSSSYTHGCRRNVTIESNDGTHIEPDLYTIDALELPPEHLNSPEHLAQALAITEAAVLVYDITDTSSLTYLKSLGTTIHDALHQPKATTPLKKRNGGFSLTSSPTRKASAENKVASRPYHFLLLGAKRDVSNPIREVSWLEGQIAAEEFFGPTGVAGGSSASFMEVSARTGEHVGAIFPLLGSQILKSRKERKDSSQQSSEQGIGGFGWDRSDFNDDGDATEMVGFEGYAVGDDFWEEAK